MLSAHRHIPYKVAGAPDNPFSFAQKAKPATSDKPEAERAHSTEDHQDTLGSSSSTSSTTIALTENATECQMTEETSQATEATASEATRSKVFEHSVSGDATGPVDQPLHHRLEASAKTSVVFTKNTRECQMTEETSSQIRLGGASDATQSDISEHCITSDTRHTTGPVDQYTEEQPEKEVNVWLSSLGKYPTDPANFRDVSINADVRAEVVRYGQSKPQDEVFPKDQFSRSFQPSWYKKNGVLREWLVYSMKEDVMFCFCCWLFPCQSHKDYEKNWSEIGVKNYRKGSEKISAHENTTLHCVSLARWKSFECRLSKGQTIDALLQEQLIKERKSALQILDRIFSATLFLALQGLPFRGSRSESQEDMMTKFVNSGNYLELLKLMARYDPVMASHLASTSKNKYTSPKVQNEVIDSIATVIRENIVEEILAAKYFCIILDTTPDITHIDQLAFSVRYICEDKPVERFLCFEEMQGGKAVDFRDKLLQLLEKFGLNPKLIRGQAMDGCSVMSGAHGGLQALVRQISPSALYVHCMAHRLNLMLAKASTSSVPMKSFFGLLESLYSFFVASPKRVAQLHKCQKNANKPNQMPKSLSETR